MFTFDNWEIVEIFDDIVLGRGVKRCIHDLEYEQSVYTSLFIERLQLFRYRPLSLKNIAVEVGQRIPAFYIKDKTALFGYVFWEVFTETRKRKIWGSVVRNEKGDWKYILPGQSSQVIFANPDRREEIDIYYLS